VFRSDEDLDASGDAGLTANEAVSFERYDQLVDRGRANLKVALHVGLGGRASEHVRVGVDESQVLALLFGESLSAGGCARRLIFDSFVDSSGPPTRRSR
jgi:hypothetical protein